MCWPGCGRGVHSHVLRADPHKTNPRLMFLMKRAERSTQCHEGSNMGRHGATDRIHSVPYYPEPCRSLEVTLPRGRNPANMRWPVECL